MFRKASPPAAHDHNIEELLLLGHVALHFDQERGANEEVVEEQAKDAVPVSGRISLRGYRTILPASA
jgi:hypothetical protein